MTDPQYPPPDAWGVAAFIVIPLVILIGYGCILVIVAADKLGLL